jgi:hypothetical protein
VRETEAEKWQVLVGRRCLIDGQSMRNLWVEPPAAYLALHTLENTQLCLTILVTTFWVPTIDSH